MFGRESTNDDPMYVCPTCPDIQSQAMERKYDVVDSAEVYLQPNKKRRMLREALSLSKRRSFRKLFVNMENEINLRGYIKKPLYDPPPHITIRDKRFLSELRQMVAIRLREDQRNAKRLGDASSRIWGCSSVNVADC
jgi:hypothetical protein